ncbi:MAG: hypothetical protein GY895_05255 [Phycisphaera sp.]|nr:hypothetical protein [Phycisphaera sp.]
MLTWDLSNHESVVEADTLVVGSRNPADLDLDLDHDLARGDLELERPEFIAPSNPPSPVPDTYERLRLRNGGTESRDEHDRDSKHLDFLLSEGPIPENRSVISREFRTAVGAVQHPYTNAQDVATSVAREDDDVATPDGADFSISRLSLAETLDESIRLSRRANGSRLRLTARDSQRLRNAIAGRTMVTTTYRDVDGDGDLEEVTSATSRSLTVIRVDGVSPNLPDRGDVICTLMRSGVISNTRPQQRSDGIYPRIRRRP